DQEYSSLQTAGSIGLAAIRASLPQDAVLVEFYRVRDTFQVCLVTHDGLKIVPVATASSLRRVLQLLRFQLSKFRLGPDYIRTFHNQLLAATNAHLHEFYEQLIAPIEADIRQASHLIIAPHDFLHYLPFYGLHDAGLTPLGE